MRHRNLESAGIWSNFHFQLCDKVRQELADFDKRLSTSKKMEIWKVLLLCLEVSLFSHWVGKAKGMPKRYVYSEVHIRAPPFNLEKLTDFKIGGIRMKRIPKRIFKLEGKEYIEISYEEYEQLMQQSQRPHFWLFGGMLLEIPEKAHMEMNRERSRRMYVYKQSKNVEEFSYESMTTGEYEGDIILVDEQPDVYEIVEQKLVSEELHKAMEELSVADRELIQALYFDECSERAYAKQVGLSQVAVHKRKKQVLEKLRTKLM